MALKLHTAKEAADILRTTPWVVANLCRSGELRASKPRGSWLIAEDDLAAYVEAHVVEVEAAP